MVAFSPGLVSASRRRACRSDWSATCCARSSSSYVPAQRYLPFSAFYMAVKRTFPSLAGRW